MATRRPALTDPDVEMDQDHGRDFLADLFTLGPADGLTADGLAVDERRQRAIVRTTPRRTARRTARPRPATPEALAVAAPYAATGVVALALSVAGGLLSGFSLPIAAMLLLTLMAIGFVVTRAMEQPRLARISLINLVIAATLLPLLALQTTLARAPYVAVEWGTATPPFVATVGVIATLCVIAFLIAMASIDTPEESSLLFTPAALLVPSILGVRGELSEARSLAALGETLALCAAAAFIAWMLPREMRPLIGPAALGAQFLVLWLIGRGPSFQTTSGEIVPILYGAMLATVVMLVVAIPIFAVWFRRIALEVERLDPDV
jgi:hypothetical protein